MPSPTSPSSPAQANFINARKRTNTASSVAHSVASFTEDLVLRHDPPTGFFAGTAQATSKAPTVGEIRRGSFGQDGWRATQRGSGSGSGSSAGRRRGTQGSSTRQSKGERELDGQVQGQGGEGYGAVEMFAPLTEEPAMIAPANTERKEEEEEEEEDIGRAHVPPGAGAVKARSDHDRIAPISKDQRVYSSGYIPPPKIPWTTSTLIGLTAFWKWFTTPFGFLLTLYGLNVVAWGGMLFLLLCNASQAMCWAPIPTRTNRQHMSPAAGLRLNGPLYYNCNDINAPRRIWIEIDSQILNALFCVTGFGLVPWRFRDLYYLLRWRMCSERKYGRDRKEYGLRVLAGIHRGWFRLPGSETLDAMSVKEYVATRESVAFSHAQQPDLEASASQLAELPDSDPRVPLPIVKRPEDPITSVRAPPTALWKLDFFVWTQVWNTFFQCCLCGFMWGFNRYTRPSWSTGLFVALACIIAGVGGLVSFLEGKKVKRVEGVPPQVMEVAEDDGDELRQMESGRTGHESVSVDDEKKKGVGSGVQ